MERLPSSLQACWGQRFGASSALPQLSTLPWCISAAQTLRPQGFSPTSTDWKHDENKFIDPTENKYDGDDDHHKKTCISYMKKLGLTRSMFSFLISSKVMSALEDPISLKEHETAIPCDGSTGRFDSQPKKGEDEEEEEEEQRQEEEMVCGSLSSSMPPSMDYVQEKSRDRKESSGSRATFQFIGSDYGDSKRTSGRRSNISGMKGVGVS